MGGGIQLIPNDVAIILFSNPQSLPQNYISYFKETEILFDNSSDFNSSFGQYKEASFRLTNQNPLNIIFTLTYNCNMACTYCFQRRQNSKSFTHTMSMEIIKSAKNIVNSLELLNHFSTGKSNIYLYGGEPLMNNPMLYEAVESLCNTFHSTNEIFITTNGYDLDYFIKLFEKYSNFNIQITLDGPKEIHDKRRISKHNDSSFTKILSNLNKISTIDHKIMIRMNIDEENYHYTDKLIEQLCEQDYFKNKNISDFLYFAPVTNREKEDVNLDFYKCFIDYYFENLYEAKIKVSNLRPLDYAIRLFGGENISPSNFYCDALYGKYIIDPYGNIGICEEAILGSNQIFGKIEKDIKVSVSPNDWKNRSVDELEFCKSCKYKYLCSGGCPWKALNCRGNVNEPICDNFPEIFEYSVDKLYEIHSQ